jgi:hypothetical protein
MHVNMRECMRARARVCACMGACVRALVTAQRLCECVGMGVWCVTVRTLQRPSQLSEGLVQGVGMPGHGKNLEGPVPQARHHRIGVPDEPVSVGPKVGVGGQPALAVGVQWSGGGGCPSVGCARAQ